MKWIALSWFAVLLSGAGPLMPRLRHPWLRLVLSLFCIVTLTGGLIPLVGSPIYPRFLADDGPTGLSEKIFVAVWWLLVARATIAGGQLALRINHGQNSARLLSDLVAGAVYVGAALTILDLAFGVSVTGLVATSGIIAIVLGLALQNTIGDLFSGIAMRIDRPFDIGDLISIDGSIEGRVLETNWRSTRVATSSKDIATVPNNVIAKSRITNRSVPSEVHVGVVTLAVDPSVAPERAFAMFQDAVCNVAAISPPLAATILITELSGNAVVYEVNFPVLLPLLAEARSQLLRQVARHARYNGIALAPQNSTPLVSVVAPDALQLLQAVDILRALDSEERKTLLSLLVQH
jgi:small-conductance mechanosensitive channel